MIQIDTKFKIGDIVRAKTKKTIRKEIPCPFCDGKGYIEYEDSNLYCGECINGMYEIEDTEEIWGHDRTVIGAAIKSDFSTKYKNKKMICVTEIFDLISNSVSCFGEDELVYANEVKEGELCE